MLHKIVLFMRPSQDFEEIESFLCPNMVSFFFICCCFLINILKGTCLFLCCGLGDCMFKNMLFGNMSGKICCNY